MAVGASFIYEMCYLTSVPQIRAYLQLASSQIPSETPLGTRTLHLFVGCMDSKEKNRGILSKILTEKMTTGYLPLKYSFPARIWILADV